MASSYLSKVSSNQNMGVPFFFLFGSWSLVIYFHVFVKAKFFLITLTWQSKLAFKVSMCLWLCLYDVSDDVFVIQHRFMKMFHLQQNTCLRFSMMQQFLLRLPRIRSRSFLFVQSGKVPFQSFFYLPTKKYVATRKIIFMSISPITFFTEWTSIGL